MTNENQGLLTSWKEIAAYLRVSSRTAQLWESERGLPVRRAPGRRSMVWADKSELDAWRNTGSSAGPDGFGEQKEAEKPGAPQPRNYTSPLGDSTATPESFDEPPSQPSDSESVVTSNGRPYEVESPGGLSGVTRQRWRWRWMGVAAVCLLVFLHVHTSPLSWDRPPPRVTQLTSQAGIEVLPDLSPDGTQVAFGASPIAEGDTQLTLMAVRGGASRSLGDIAHGGNPRWSPDGQQIAAMRRDPLNEEVAELALFSLADGTTQHVTTLAGYQRLRNVRNFLALDWKPDGTAIAVTDIAAPNEPLSLYEVTISSGFRRRLSLPPSSIVGDNQPVYSPDGRWLAFVRQVTYSEGDIYLLPNKGGDPKRLTSLNADINGLTWLPDSSGLILATDRGTGIQALWRISLDNPDRFEHVTGTEGNATHPSSIRVDEDGTAALAYEFNRWDVNVWKYDVAAGMTNGAPVTTWTSLEYNPQFSPDGLQLAFASKRSGAMEIWVCGSDGSNPRQLTDRRQGFTDSPRWSPDGKWIAFTSNEGSNRDIYIVPGAGGSERRLMDDDSEEGRPSWSADGQWIYFRSNRSGEAQIWKVRWEGGNPIQVTTGGGYEGFESPDGKTLYYVRTRQWTGLWEVPSGGGTERLVLDDVYQTGWAVTHDAIYYRAYPSTELRRWDLRNGETSVVGELSRGRALYGSALSVRFDGGAVAFSQIDDDGVDLFTLAVPDWRKIWR